MAKISDIINRRIDIVELVGRYTELSPVGSLLQGRCPIHGSKEGMPLRVFPHNNSYFCFACESGGGPVNFYADVENIPYRTALEILAKECNININSDEQYQKEVSIEERYTSLTERAMKNVGNVVDYLHKRGLTDDTIQEFKLGEDGGTLVIPITNEFGQIVNVAKRQFEGKPKYKNGYNNALYDKSSLLYGLDKARKNVKERQAIYLVEGYMDAISGYQLGLATVAYCGNEVQSDQVRTLQKYIRKEVTIILCPDNDEEGLKRVPKVRETFKKMGLSAKLYVLELPDTCKDLNDLLIQKIDIDSLPLVHIDKYCVNLVLAKCKQLEDEYNQMHNYMKTVDNSLVKSDIIKYLASKWNRQEEELREFFKADIDSIDTLLKDADKTEACINDLKRLYTRGELKTGFQQIDNCIGGLTKTQVFLIGAYSASGKTQMAIEYILRQLSQNKSRVIFFSLEMPKGKVLERMIAMIVGCRLRDVRDIVMSGDEKIQKVIDKLDERLIIYDQNDLSIYDIEKRIQAVNQKRLLGGDVDVVVVDYFGYLKGTNDFEGASKQAKYMKYLAKTYNIVFCMLAQLNRSANTYDEPTMDMLKMTGDLEASADVILMMWRPDREPNISLEKQQRLENITKMKIEKSRDGIYGPTRMEFKYNINNSRLEEQIEA